MDLGRAEDEAFGADRGGWPGDGTKISHGGETTASPEERLWVMDPWEI